MRQEKARSHDGKDQESHAQVFKTKRRPGQNKNAKMVAIEMIRPMGCIILWEKKFDEGVLFRSFDETADGGFILGADDHGGEQGNQLRLIKTNASGEVEWSRDDIGVRSVRQTSDGGYAAVRMGQRLTAM